MQANQRTIRVNDEAYAKQKTNNNDNMPAGYGGHIVYSKFHAGMGNREQGSAGIRGDTYLY